MAASKTDLDFPTEMIHEGKVKLIVPKLEAYAKSPSDYAPSKAPVFYNPVMELNRDIAVLALQTYQHTVKRRISICEPLAACGAMGIRLAAEVKGAKKVVMSDINSTSTGLAKLNIELNNLEKKVTVKNVEANALLSQHSAPHKRFDAIDIDPFGSPVPFLDSAIRALRNQGLLAVTATDMAPLCGVHPRACVRKYGGRPQRTEYCHELAVRLLAGSLATTAARSNMGMSMVFSHCSDHYVRVYAVIGYGAKTADEAIKNTGYVLHCFKCYHRETIHQHSLVQHGGKCPECSQKLSVAGPLWLGRILDKRFCEQMAKEAEGRALRLQNRILKILALARGEAEAPPTYYVIDRLCGALTMPVPPVKKVADALRRQGFLAVPTHFNPKALKSDASASKMKEVLRGASGSSR